MRCQLKFGGTSSSNAVRHLWKLQASKPWGIWELSFVQDSALCGIQPFSTFFFFFFLLLAGGRQVPSLFLVFCQTFFPRQACRRHARLVGWSHWHGKHLWLKTSPLLRHFHLLCWTEPLVKISSCHHPHGDAEGQRQAAERHLEHGQAMEEWIESFMPSSGCDFWLDSSLVNILMAPILGLWNGLAGLGGQKWFEVPLRNTETVGCESLWAVGHGLPCLHSAPNTTGLWPIAWAAGGRFHHEKSFGHTLQGNLFLDLDGKAATHISLGLNYTLSSAHKKANAEENLIYIWGTPALSSGVIPGAGGRWSSPPGGVGGQRCTNRCTTNTRHLKRRPARLPSRPARFCNYRLCYGVGCNSPWNYPPLLDQHVWYPESVGEQPGTACTERHLQGGPDRLGRAPPPSSWLGLLPLALSMIARCFSKWGSWNLARN